MLAIDGVNAISGDTAAWSQTGYVLAVVGVFSVLVNAIVVRRLIPRIGERRALLFYRLRGYRLVDANARVGRYELDLVLRRGRSLVFVEVKEKAGSLFGDPLEMIDEEKVRRVHTAAGGWLAAHPEHAGFDLRFDAVLIAPKTLPRHLMAAFDAGP